MEAPLVTTSGSEAAGCWVPVFTGTTPGVGYDAVGGDGWWRLRALQRRLPAQRLWTPTPSLPLKNGEGVADCGTLARGDSVSTVMAGLDPATQIMRPTR